MTTNSELIDCGRIDHSGIVPEIYAGLFLTSLYLMQLGPTLFNLSDFVEDIINLLLFTGSVLALIGATLGTRLFWPHFPRKRSYYIQLCGIPMLILALAWYTYASVDTKDFVTTALGGGLGLCIEIGLVRLFINLVQDLILDHTGHNHD